MDRFVYSDQFKLGYVSEINNEINIDYGNKLLKYAKNNFPNNLPPNTQLLDDYIIKTFLTTDLYVQFSRKSKSDGNELYRNIRTYEYDFSSHRFVVYFQEFTYSSHDTIVIFDFSDKLMGYSCTCNKRYCGHTYAANLYLNNLFMQRKIHTLNKMYPIVQYAFKPSNHPKIGKLIDKIKQRNDYVDIKELIDICATEPNKLAVAVLQYIINNTYFFYPLNNVIQGFIYKKELKNYIYGNKYLLHLTNNEFNIEHFYNISTNMEMGLETQKDALYYFYNNDYFNTFKYLLATFRNASTCLTIVDHIAPYLDYSNEEVQNIIITYSNNDSYVHIVPRLMSHSTYSNNNIIYNNPNFNGKIPDEYAQNFSIKKTLEKAKNISSDLIFKKLFKNFEEFYNENKKITLKLVSKFILEHAYESFSEEQISNLPDSEYLVLSLKAVKRYKNEIYYCKRYNADHETYQHLGKHQYVKNETSRKINIYDED